MFSAILYKTKNETEVEILILYTMHLFSDLPAFRFLEKAALHENCVSGTVLMFQLTRNSPSSTYIG